ncbi:Yip1 family protein [Sulfurimonas sp.]|uniref:Yip1 family protein n=1 Tax=Sulfurimonas sp. TaxID=2022749 RepID=UPI0026191C6A|nr:Yip1 family protein [Sulfurimonas sp.]MCW8894436.1 YIP1 family protein [Sulfurimonas sp.]
MRTGLLVGVFLKYIIALLPVILIIFSKLVSGKTKVKWALAVLLIPYVLKEMVYVIVMLQGDALQMHGSIVLGGWAPAIPLIWYISAWSIYFYFKIKYGSPKIKKRTKIIAGILLTILVVWGLVFVFNTYKEQEAKTILKCGTEKIFTKNLQSNKLYFTSNHISKNASSRYIGNLDGDDIILKNDNYQRTIKRLKACLKFSDELNIIYPKDSIYNKSWGWEKDTYDVNSKLLFSSEESVCPSDKSDKREKDEYEKWTTQYGDHSIKTNSDSFVFDVNNTSHTVKAETIEFSQHFIGTTFSTNENKYIFRTSIDDSSKIILWKFSKNGDFIKEVHIKLPKNVIIVAGRGYYISHIKIDKDKIQFRLYERYRSNQDRGWKIMCSYHTLEIENKI